VTRPSPAGGDTGPIRLEEPYPSQARRPVPQWRVVQWAWAFAAVITALGIAAVVAATSAWIVWTIWGWFQHSA
jgi:hypothetical protein